MIGRGWRRVLAVVLSVVFVTGSAGEVYGLHDCPHHHSSPAVPSGSSAGGSAESPAPKSEPLEPSSHGPCTCIGTCHGGATASAMALVQGTPAVPPGETRRLPPSATPETALPRNVSFLLPYPTGPPAPGHSTSA